MNFNEHIRFIAKKANKLLGIIFKVFTSKSPDTIIPLYKTIVCPHLEYNSIIWSPYTKMNEDILENIQKRMCRKLYGYRSHSYKETLKKLIYYPYALEEYEINW